MIEQVVFDIDADLRAVFIEEAREQIEILDQGILRLERESTNSELIQEIFRAAHTLKGSSGVIGFRQMAELTHAMEDVLEQIRSEKLAVTSAVTDGLLKALDQLRTFEAMIEEGQSAMFDSVDYAQRIAELHRIAQQAPAHDDDVATMPSVAPLLSALAADQAVLLVNFTDDCQMPSVRAMMVLRALASHGEILDCRPLREAIEQGNVDHRLLVVIQSPDTDEDLCGVVRSVAEVGWVRLARGAAAAGMRLDMPERDQTSAEDEAAPVMGQTAAHGAQPQPQVQATVRIHVETLDRMMNLIGELVLERARMSQFSDELRAQHPHDECVRELDMVSQHIGAIIGELHEKVLQARMLPVSQLFNRFPRLVRDLCRTMGKEIDLYIDGEDEQLDRTMIEKLVDPLTHLMRNAVDHGMEPPEVREAHGKPRTGTVQLSAHRHEEYVFLSISDDGPGIQVAHIKEVAIAKGVISAERARTMSEQDALALIFQSGFTTATSVSDVSGRGVGMEVVKKNIESLNGAVSIESHPGAGTTFTLKLPLTLAIIRALIVRVGTLTMALPLTFIEETMQISRKRINHVQGQPFYQWRGMAVPVIHLAEVFDGCGEASRAGRLQLIIVRSANRVVGLAVDGIFNHQEIVVRALGTYIGEVSGLAGATILGNGRIAFIVDIAKLFDGGMQSRSV